VSFNDASFVRIAPVGTRLRKAAATEDGGDMHFPPRESESGEGARVGEWPGGAAPVPEWSAAGRSGPDCRLPGLRQPPSLNRPGNIKPDGDLGPGGKGEGAAGRVQSSA
jgi:hypothetical protein